MATAPEINHYPSRSGNKPKLLKRIDPLLYQDWSENAPLSEQQTLSYAQNGFLVIENLFSPEEVAIMKSEGMRLRAKPDSLMPETILYENKPEIQSIFMIHRQSYKMARLAQDDRLANIAQFLLGDHIYIHQSRLDYKPAFRGKQTFWYSDFETWHLEDGMPRMQALSISLLLSENSPANGSLLFLPQSHKHFLSCNLNPQAKAVPDTDNISVLAQSGITIPTGAPGTLILFDSNIMQGSNSNITPLPRFNASFVYNALSNTLQKPFGNKPPRPGFIATRPAIKPLKPVKGSLDDPQILQQISREISNQ